MIRRLAFAAVLCLASQAFAQDATEATIERLFAAMQLEKTMQAAQAMMGASMRQAATQMLPPDATPEQRRMAEASAAGVAAALRESLGWESLKPQMVKLYAGTFTEAEVLGIVAFYESPAGQAFTMKMPALMQKSMAMSQERMREMMPRLKAAIDKAMAEAREAQGR